MYSYRAEHWECSDKCLLQPLYTQESLKEVSVDSTWHLYGPLQRSLTPGSCALFSGSSGQKTIEAWDIPCMANVFTYFCTVTPREEGYWMLTTKYGNDTSCSIAWAYYIPNHYNKIFGLGFLVPGSFPCNHLCSLINFPWVEFYEANIA